MGHSFINSALIAFPSTIFPLFIGSLAALRSRGSASRSGDTIFLFIVALMVVPLQARSCRS